MTVAICAASPQVARAETPEGMDPGFCLTGVNRIVEVAPDFSYVSVFDYCADAGGYGDLHMFIPPPAPPPPPKPPKPPMA